MYDPAPAIREIFPDIILLGMVLGIIGLIAYLPWSLAKRRGRNPGKTTFLGIIALMLVFPPGYLLLIIVWYLDKAPDRRVPAQVAEGFAERR